MSRQLAIDVALLPPPLILNQIVALTAHLPNTPTRLNTTDCLPHITLAMGLISQNKLSEVISMLQQLPLDAGDITIDIEQTRSYQWKDSPLGPFSELIVVSNPGLLRLHQNVMETIKPYVTYSHVKLENFVAPPDVSKQSIVWVAKYGDHHKSPETFHGHITLGEGEIDQLKKPIHYSGSQLGLCQLGTYCTCRKVLAMI